jgi:hypothetical protein
VPIAGEMIRRIAPVLGMRPGEVPGAPAPLLYTLAGNE